MKPAAASPAAPLYELYGELGRDDALDGLHHESIADRSRLHNWEIRPHRHGGLSQLLLIERGRADVELDRQRLVLHGPALVWVPPFVIHGFAFAPETEGHVVTLDDERLRQQLAASPGLWDELRHARALVVPKASPVLPGLLMLLQGLRAEYLSLAPWRARMLEGALSMLAAGVARQPRLAPVATAMADGEGRAMLHLQRFREQVERQFRRHPGLAELAAPLGISPAQLNRLCRRHLQCSALELLHQRLLLEAKRELGYTSLQIRQVSDGLGFSDPAYFTRFFQRLTGQSPKAWREQGGRG